MKIWRWCLTVLFFTVDLGLSQNHSHNQRETNESTADEHFDHMPDRYPEVDPERFEDLGHIFLGQTSFEGRIRILQITDLHRFPTGQSDR